MRNTKDRIRHAVSFEIIGLVLVTPTGSWLFGTSMHNMGALAVIGATIATIWNYVYNLVFDLVMLRLRNSVLKTLPIRIAHAVIFETGLLIVLLPFIAWFLNTSLVRALQMDVSFALFYVIYAFVFNWLYDIVFPIPQGNRAANAIDN